MSTPPPSLPSPPRPNRALERLRRGELVRLYVTGNLAIPRHIDFISQSGEFDAIWFDLEHFDLPVQEIALLNMVARSHGVTTIARIRAVDYQTVMRVLEVGSGGIMCSMVNSPEEAAAIVGWAKFRDPAAKADEPQGQRGWNGGNVDALYGNFRVADYIRYQNTQTMILAQIETPAGVAAVDQIAAVPGIDGLFFGPGDYAHALGLAGQFGHPEVVSALRRVAGAAAAAGKFWGTVAPSAEGCAQAYALGARLICPGGDNRLANLGLRELARTFEGIVPGGLSAPSRPVGGAAYG